MNRRRFLRAALAAPAALWALTRGLKGETAPTLGFSDNPRSLLGNPGAPVIEPSRDGPYIFQQEYQCQFVDHTVSIVARGWRMRHMAHGQFEYDFCESAQWIGSGYTFRGTETFSADTMETKWTNVRMVHGSEGRETPVSDLTILYRADTPTKTGLVTSLTVSWTEIL